MSENHCVSGGHSVEAFIPRPVELSVEVDDLKTV